MLLYCIIMYMKIMLGYDSCVDDDRELCVECRREILGRKSILYHIVSHFVCGSVHNTINASGKLLRS